MNKNMKNIFYIFMGVVMTVFSQSATAESNFGSNSKAGNYINVNDIKLYYEVYGKGEPLLLLHGNGGSIENFSNQIDEFSKQFMVIAIDSRAQGRSTDSDQELSYALMASDVAALIDKIKIKKVNVVGWSDGGNIGLELAYSYPDKIKKLVAIGANYTHVNWENDRTWKVKMDKKDPIILKTQEPLKKYIEAPEKLSADPKRLPDIRKKLDDLMQKYPNFTEEQLKKILTPVLLIVGDHDMINEEQTFYMHKTLPHAELCVFPSTTHMSPWERPEWLNQQVLRFLNEPYREIDNFYFFRDMAQE